MKKLVVIVLAAFLVMTFAGVSFATKDNTGCGLGYIIFKGKDGLVSQTFAATTNGTFGNQTFGISSGTSECDRPSNFTANEKLNKFASDNMDNLAWILLGVRESTSIPSLFCWKYRRMKEHVSIPSFRHISPTFTPLLLSPTSTF